MSPYFDSMRKWVQPAGPKEGRDPVRVSRAYVALRRGVLATSPAALGLAPSQRLPRVWAVLVDLEAGAEAVTVACVADGAASVYTGSGGGILGSGAAARVSAAAGRLLEVVEQVLDALPTADRIALPPAGSVAFLVLTYDGMRRLEVPAAEAQGSAAGGAGAADAAHELYAAARDVVAELHLVDAAGG